MMVETKFSVNFACQRCLQPLKIDESFSTLSEHELAEINCNVTNKLRTLLQSKFMFSFVSQ
jgi:beclin